MAYNAMAFKKTMLAWETIAKHTPADITAIIKKMSGEHPEYAKAGKTWTSSINTFNQKIGDHLDKVVSAKDDKKRGEAVKGAVGTVKQFENFVRTAHLPTEIEKKLKTGLLNLAKGVQNSV